MSKSRITPPETIYDEEHKQLHEAVDQLRTRIDEAHQRALAAIASFDRLHDSLQRHFEAEERSGAFFDEIVTQAPRLSGRVDQLRAEHVTMLKLVDKLEDDLELEELVPWESIDTQLNELSEMFSRHEAAERELMQTAFTEDVGDKD